MKNTFGNAFSVTLFGESHGDAIGAVIDGIAPGVRINQDFIKHKLSLRRPEGEISTPRKEADNFQIISGVFKGFTTGTPLCIIIPNENTKSQDYSVNRNKARPGHADFTAFSKYHGFEDYRGGGHFSGRITAALVAVGAIAEKALENKNIFVGTHIKSVAEIKDREFLNFSEDIKLLSEKTFAVLDDERGKEMKNRIIAAKEARDSVGGVLETVVTGLPAGIGEPWFDTVEGVLSHALFSVPAVKGVEFGAGFSISDMTGSCANDEFRINNNIISTISNNNGGINGGITNGMPIIFRTAVKPTPTIGKIQKTVDFIKNENTKIESAGRHDPCIVHRARAVVDAVTALAICDLLLMRYGTDWLVL